MTQEKVKHFFNWFQPSPLASIGKASTCHTERGMTKRWERKVVITTVLADGLVELEPIPMTAKKHGLI
jgi:hypothetical protein